MPFQVQTSELRISVPGLVLWCHKDVSALAKISLEKIRSIDSHKFDQLWYCKDDALSFAIDVTCFLCEKVKIFSGKF